MRWTAEEIRRQFSGRLIGDFRMRKVVSEALLYLPSGLIKHVTSRVWFLSSPEDAWALTFKGSDITGQHLILLSVELLEQDDNSIKYTILHEIGHVVLNHRNSMGFRQAETEVNKQEQEADEFAKKWLRTD